MMHATASGPRFIVPVLVNKTEKFMLQQLAVDSKLSMSGVVRVLILKETAGRQLVRQGKGTP